MTTKERIEFRSVGNHDIKVVVEAPSEEIKRFTSELPERVRSCSTTKELSKLFVKEILPLFLQTDVFSGSFYSPEQTQSRLDALRMLEIFIMCLTEKLPSMLLQPDELTFKHQFGHTNQDRLLRYRTETVASVNTLRADIEYTVLALTEQFQDTIKKSHTGDLTEKLQAQINLFTAALIQHNLDIN